MFIPTPLIPPLFKGSDKITRVKWLLICPGTPACIMRVQYACAYACPSYTVATLQQKSCNNVRLRLILIRGLLKCPWGLKSLLLPCLAALYGPPQNTGQLGLELAIKFLILIFLRNRDRERDQANTPPSAIIGPSM